MPTNKTLLSVSIKYLSGALPLLFLGPAVIYNAFINKNNLWHYLVLFLGIALCITAVFLMIKGLKIMMRSIFND